MNCPLQSALLGDVQLTGSDSGGICGRFEYLCLLNAASQQLSVYSTLLHCTNISTETLEPDISLTASWSIGDWAITVRVLSIGTMPQVQQKHQGSRAPNPEATDLESRCTRNLLRKSPSAKSWNARNCFPVDRPSARQPVLLPRSSKALNGMNPLLQRFLR